MSAPIWIRILLHSTDYLLELIAAIWLLASWRGSNDRSRLYLGLFFVASLVGSVGAVAVWAQQAQPVFFPLLSPVSTVFGYPIFFLLVLYVLTCCDPEGMTRRRWLWLTIPWLLLGSATMLVCHWVQTPLLSPHEVFINLDKTDVLLRLLSQLLYIPYGIYVCRIAFSKPCDRRFMPALSVLLLLMTFTYVLGNGFRFWTFDVLHTLFYIAVAVLTLVSEFSPKKEDSTPVTSDPHFMDFPLEKRIRLLLDVERIWLNPELTLDDMAQQAGTNRTYLLQKVKELGYRNFSDMVNRHRVAYAQSESALHPEEPMLDILFRSGYRSRTSAIRNFQTITGNSPLKV